MDRLRQRYREVGGFALPKTVDLGSVVGQLPRYIPVIDNGACRIGPLDVPVVAIPAHEMLGLRRDGTYGVRPRGLDIQRRLKLASATRFIITGVGIDTYLELLWKLGELHCVGNEIASLTPVAMTAPNFSFFDGIPRPHIEYNRKRSVLMAEYLASCGVPMVLHLNALTAGDWEIWLKLLQANSNIVYIAKEFQTALARRERGRSAIRDLGNLQAKLGRQLHLIAIGGGRYAREISDEFEDFTIADGRPFVLTMKRKIFEVVAPREYRVSDYPTEHGAKLDDLLLHNIKTREQWINDRVGSAGMSIA